MKSTLCLLGLATFALTSCVQNEVLDMPEGKPIEFSSFVEKGTRALSPINSRAALTNFWVFGENGDDKFLLDSIAIDGKATCNSNVTCRHGCGDFAPTAESVTLLHRIGKSGKRGAINDC